MHEGSGGVHASTEQLSALLDERAEPEEQTFLAGHVDQCVACSRELAGLRSVRDLLGSLPAYVPPRGFTIPVEAVAAPHPRFRRLIPLTRALGTIAAALCVLLFAADLLRIGGAATAPVPDGSSAFQITTAAKATAAPAAAPRPAEAAKPALAPTPTGAAPAALAGGGGAAGAAPAQAQDAARAPLAAAPQVAQGTTTALAATQPPAAPVAQTVPTTAPVQSAGGITGQPSAPVQRAAAPTPIASPWLSRIRLTALAFALLAGIFMIGSVVLSRMARASVAGGGRSPRR